MWAWLLRLMEVLAGRHRAHRGRGWRLVRDESISRRACAGGGPPGRN